MPEQLLTFELEKLSQGRQGAILDNCYFAPATDGNAVVQVCAFPKLEAIGKWSEWLEGCTVKHVAKCYNWQVIYGEKNEHFFVKIYDADKNSEPIDKTSLFYREGFMGYDNDNYFCCKPFWTLRPVQESSDSRCIAILINEYMWVVDIEFSVAEPVVIKGELHYISEDLRKITDMNLQTAYMDVHGDNVSVSKWSANTADWADNSQESWNQLADYVGDIQVPMTPELKSRLKQLVDDPRKMLGASWIDPKAREYAEKLYPDVSFNHGAYYGKWALDTSSRSVKYMSLTADNCWWYSYVGASKEDGKIRDYYNNEIKTSLNTILAVQPGMVIPKTLLDAAVQKIEYFIKPNGDKPHCMTAYSYVDKITGFDWRPTYLRANYDSCLIFSEGDDFTPSVIAWMAMIRWLLTDGIIGNSQIDSRGLESLRSVADATRSNANAILKQTKAYEQDKDAIIAAAGKKMGTGSAQYKELELEFKELGEWMDQLEGLLRRLDTTAGEMKILAQPILATTLRRDIAFGNDPIYEAIRVVLTEMAPVIDSIINILMQYNVDYSPTFFDVLSSMLIVIATDNRFYYSDAGTINIEGDNFFAAQSGGGQSIPTECHRLGNRLCLITKDTVEFWDSTLDYQQPLSPQYGHNVYSYEVVKDTVAVYDDTIYCLAKSNLLPYRSVYRIAKNGAMEKISYPELDAYINDRPAGSVKASLIELSKKPFVSFWLGDKTLNYDIAGNMFCLSDEILMYMNMPDGTGFYLRWNAAEAGSLVNRADTVAKLSTPPMAMGRSSKCLKLIQVEVDNHDAEKLVCEIDRQGSHDFNTTRAVLFKPGNHRNMMAKYENWGMINNSRMTLTWKGDLRINKAQWVME
jgi:hypothetical protein